MPVQPDTLLTVERAIRGETGQVRVGFADKETLTVDMLAHEPLIMYSINDADSQLDAQLQKLLGGYPVH